VTNLLALAMSTYLFVKLLNIELDVAGMNGERGSDIEIEGCEKRSSLAAAMRTIG
jgi:hypothetical protein